MNLPEDFKNKYREILSTEDYEKFIASFDEPAVSGFRINPLKKLDLSGEIYQEPMPDSDFGYYGKISGKSVEFLTGQLYSQEPAAQQVGQVAKPEKGLRVLDLCAAPGGKSSHLSAYLENTGLLVSNEISGKRSKVLVENLERWGARNTVVLNESPENLAKVFPAFFDMIVIDAPCSGEGMFRKDPAAMQYWSQDYVLDCAQRQKEILLEALKMLAPQGKLVYSTCTWSPEEDEEMVAWLLEKYPSLKLLQEKKYWPFEFQGEGQFLALLENQVNPENAEPSEGLSNESFSKKKLKKQKKQTSKLPSMTSEQKTLWQDFVKQNFQLSNENESLAMLLEKGHYQLFADNLYLLPADLPDLSKLKIARNGLHLGQFKKKRFEPSYALALALRVEEAKQVIELKPEEFKKYIAGESLQLDESHISGWYLLTIAGNPISFAKVVGNTVKNYYPKGLRQVI